MVPRPLPLLPPSPQRHDVGTGARVAELLQLLHTPLADTLLVAERLNVARINIAVAQNARQDLERQPSKLVDLCVALASLLGCPQDPPKENRKEMGHTLGKSADFQPTKSSRPRNTLRARSKGSQGRSMT